MTHIDIGCYYGSVDKLLCRKQDFQTKIPFNTIFFYNFNFCCPNLGDLAIKTDKAGCKSSKAPIRKIPELTISFEIILHLNVLSQNMCWIFTYYLKLSKDFKLQTPTAKFAK